MPAKFTHTIRSRPILGLLVWTSLVGCGSATALLSPEPATDVAPDDEVFESGLSDTERTDSDPVDSAPADSGLADSGGCVGRDEDGDGIPDDCDNCPNVPNRDQAVGFGGTGKACMPPSFLIEPSRRRFDPLVTFAGADWLLFGRPPALFRLEPSKDEIVGGSEGDIGLAFAVSRAGLGSASASVTTVMEVDKPKKGVLSGVAMRVNLIDGTDRSQFFACGVDVSASDVSPAAFGIARTPEGGCNGGPCALRGERVEPGGAGAWKNAPFEMGAGKRFGIQVSVSEASTEVECRLWDVANPVTLTSTDPKYFVRAAIAPSRWLARGDFAPFVDRGVRARFFSFDVLTGR